MLKKIIRQKFVSIERQSTELDNLAFVVLKVFEFGLQLCYENVAIIPQNIVFKQQSQKLE